MDNPILNIRHLGFEADGKSILTDINLQVARGTSLTIKGPSGSGKSTLLRLIATLLTPTSGEIEFEGQPVSTYKRPEYRKEVSYCFQQPTLFGDVVKDNLMFPFQIRNQAFDEKRALSALNDVDLPDSILDQDITELSGGEKQRVALVRNLLFQPKILLLDEISAGLDTATKGIVHRLIETYRSKGVTLIAVTHDESEIAAADMLYEIKAGRMEVNAS